MASVAASARSSRQLILSAALSTFEDHGYGTATMSDIRREAGVSNGSLYHHFPSKDHVAAALFAEGVDDYQEGFLAMLAGAADAEAGIRGGVKFHLGWARRNQALARFLLHAMQAGEAGGERRPASERRPFLREVHGWLRREAQAGAVVELPRDLYYPIWIGPAQELTRQLLAGRVRLSARDAARYLADEAWRSLRTKTR